MKKMLVMAVALVVFLCTGISAQERFIVQNVVGNVEQEVSSGKWEAVKTGDALAADTVIRTRLNSSLVIKLGERSSTVGAMQRGVLRDLAGGGGSGIGIRIEGAVAETDTTQRSPTGGSSSTAAARASEAAAELILLDE